MRFTVAAAAASFVAVASAWNYTSEVPVYTTEVVTEYTTYCPGPTQITYGTQTYTVTSETTLTITNCPCTVTYPVTTATPTLPPATSTYVPPPPPTYVPPPYSNGTTYVPPPPTSAPSIPPYTSSIPISPVPTATGAANKVAGSGVGLAAVLGLAAYVL